MKNVLKFTGIIAIAAVMGLVLACKQEEKKGPSLLSAPKISEAPGWADVTGVQEATYAEAITLFNNVGQLYDALPTTFASSTQELFLNAFTAKYGQPAAWFGTNLAQSGYKLDLAIDGKGPGLDKSNQQQGDIVAVKGKTSDEFKLKGLTLGEYYNPLVNSKDGDSNSSKSSTSLTFTFPLIRVWTYGYDGSPSPTAYLVGGTLKIEDKTNYSSTIKEKATDTYATKYNNEYKYAFALTIVNTTTNKAAKFRMSRSGKDSSNQRKVSSDGYSEGSDLEVYGASDNLLGKSPSKSFNAAANIASYIDLENLLGGGN